MKRAALFAMLAALALIIPAAAQEQSLRTGIVDFHSAGKNSGEGKLVVSELSAALGRYAFISLVERSKLGALVKEMELGQSGLVDEATAARLGRVHGLQVIVEGTVSKGGVSARAIHAETARVLAAASVPSRADIVTLGERLAYGIETFLARENLKRLRNDSPRIDLCFWMEKRDGGKITGADGRGTSRIGSSVSLHFRSSADGYLTVVDIQPGGEVVLLYPNDFTPSNRISACRDYSLPSKDDEYEITVTEPAGEDTVVAFFTKKKVDWLDAKKLRGEGFRTVRDSERLGAARGLSITATKLRRDDWESAVLQLEVKR
ncbi:MAG: DUF4384 domain-containing protein [Spirochaetes bacterium]|nr:DUF4384 domain-containing protein [Spirochaetota bacterium]